MARVRRRVGDGMTPPVGAARAGVVGARRDAIPDSGLLHHYDAAQVSAADGDPVSTWTDQQGNEDLTGTAPTYQTNVINGNPILRFDAVDDVLQSGAFAATVTQPVLIYAVTAQRVGVTDSQQYHWDGNALNEMMMVGNTDASGNTFDIYSGSYVSGSATEDTNFHIHGAHYDGANSILRQDGTQTGSGDAGVDDLNGFTVGAAGNGSRFAPLDACEYLIYDATNAPTYTDIESYLSDKWGIAV